MFRRSIGFKGQSEGCYEKCIKGQRLLLAVGSDMSPVRLSYNLDVALMTGRGIRFLYRQGLPAAACKDRVIPLLCPYVLLTFPGLSLIKGKLVACVFFFFYFLSEVGPVNIIKQDTFGLPISYDMMEI